MRRGLIALALAGGLAALFVTAAHAPRRTALPTTGLVLGAAPRHRVRVKAGHASCKLLWERHWGQGLCESNQGNLHVSEAVHKVLRERTGHHDWRCMAPRALVMRGTRRVLVACVRMGRETGYSNSPVLGYVTSASG
jgi:hypothetical protein